MTESPEKPKYVRRVYRAVSTAEKRAELEASGEKWPTCECCQGLLVWQKDKHHPNGGLWLTKCPAEIRARSNYLRKRNSRLKGVLPSSSCFSIGVDEDGWPFCQHGKRKKQGRAYVCPEKERLRVLKHKEKKKASGLCRFCSGKEVVRGRVRCRECLQKQSLYWLGIKDDPVRLEAMRAYKTAWAAARRDRLLVQRVLSDPTGRRCCFPEVDRLLRRYEKANNLFLNSVGGERKAAETAVAKCITALEEKLSPINGGKEWLHSRIMSVETQSTQPATSSPLALVA